MDADKQKILICGNVCGKFKQFFQRIESVNRKSGPFHLLLCVGEFFSPAADGNDELEAFLNGNKRVAVPTYILGPISPETSQRFDGIADSGDLCPNLTYLGKRGLYTTGSGLRIAYVSGLQAPADAASAHQFTVDDVRATRNACLANLSASMEFRGVDMLLTTQWPQSIDAPHERLQHIATSSLLAWLATEIRPRYHFCASSVAADQPPSECYFERHPYRNAACPLTSLQTSTRFVSLAALGNTAKEKYIYALCLTPVNRMRLTDLLQKTTNETRCPYDARRLVQIAGTDSEPHAAVAGQPPQQQFFYDMNAPANRQPNKRRAAGPNSNGYADGEKRFRGDVNQDKCWFCLSSATVERHLVVTVGQHFYVALAKGPLNQTHCLLLPITHIQCTSLLPPDCWHELGRFKQALTQMFRSAGKATFFFERNYRTSHLQINVVAVDQDIEWQVRHAFVEAAAKYELLLKEMPPLRQLEDLPASGPYFLAELARGEVLLTRSMKMFPLHFGREVFCAKRVFASESKIDWKKCELSRDEEVAMVDQLRTQFKPFNFAETSADADEDSQAPST